ncbi:hypothetical protein BDN70DRAFT_107718 [Pholiota conissans]|uniref:Uncharacterized protein n=1 Tax=Pholiota conissans TaxID=109636 RepID=A0A9P6D669_9AGAR|nr:hypothetical protein BDN70DRAFT_107718 [Pholiota conissans]
MRSTTIDVTHSQNWIFPTARPTNHVAKRQTDANPMTATSSTSTYDYWWPYPPADISPVATTATTTPSPSVIPIIISLISASSTAPSTSSATPSSSQISLPHTDNRTLASSAPQSSSTPPTELRTNTGKPHFTPIDLAPAFGVVGFFLVGLCAWVVYGCCTRKPKVTKDAHRRAWNWKRQRNDEGDDPLMAGPPYASFVSPERDVERSGHREREREGGKGDAFSLRRFGMRIGVGSSQSRWPSYSYNPPPISAHPIPPPHLGQKQERGGYIAPGYMHDYGGDDDHNDEDSGLFSVSLIAPGRRRKSSMSPFSKHTPSSPTSTSVFTANAAGPSRHLVTRHHSSATSAALHELYSSASDSSLDSDDADRGGGENKGKGTKRARDIDTTPWESLRHKSIKRGILEQVRKEETWMDSVRASIIGAGAGKRRGDSERNRGREERVEAETEDERGPAIGRGPAQAQAAIGRRRGHVRADSDVRIAADTLGGTPDRRRDKNALRLTSPSIPPLPRATTTASNASDAHAPSPRGRRTFAWLRDHEDEDRYTPLPDRLHSVSPNRSEVQRRSKSDKSRSGSRGESRSRGGSRTDANRNGDDGYGGGRKSESRRAGNDKSTSVAKRVPRVSGSSTTRSAAGGNSARTRALDYTHGAHGGERGRERERGERHYDYAPSPSDAAARAVDLDVLPQSPPQIMSPPLESQMCFTPIPPVAPRALALVLSPGPGAAVAMGDVTRRPTRIPSPKKVAGRRRSSSRGRGYSISSGHGPKSTSALAASSGRRHANSSPKRSPPSSPPAAHIRPLRPARREGVAAARETDEVVGAESIMQKVDHIMEAGWHERSRGRDMGLEAVRSLSPTGFGRDVA